jgi:hypothetical protein
MDQKRTRCRPVPPWRSVDPPLHRSHGTRNSAVDRSEYGGARKRSYFDGQNAAGHRGIKIAHGALVKINDPARFEGPNVVDPDYGALVITFHKGKCRPVSFAKLYAFEQAA